MSSRLVFQFISIICLGFATACGVPQELYNARLTEIDRFKADLNRSQTESASLRDRLEEEAGARNRAATVEAEYMKLRRDLRATEKQLEDLKRARSQAEQRTEAYRALRLRLGPLVDDKVLQITVRQNLIRLLVDENLLFERGHAELKLTGAAAVRQIAAVLREISNRDFVVAAHTDNTIVKLSPFRSNWDLSTARAVAVVRTLQGEGVDPRHLAAAGYSEFDRLYENDTEEHRAKNRRIEITLQPREDELPTVDTSEPTHLVPTPPPMPQTSGAPESSGSPDSGSSAPSAASSAPAASSSRSAPSAASTPSAPAAPAATSGTTAPPK